MPLALLCASQRVFWGWYQRLPFRLCIQLYVVSLRCSLATSACGKSRALGWLHVVV